MISSRLFIFRIFSFILALNVSLFFTSAQSIPGCSLNGHDLSALANIPDQIASTVNECGSGLGFSYSAAVCRPVSNFTDFPCNFADANFCQMNCVNGNKCPNPPNFDLAISYANALNFAALPDNAGVSISGSTSGAYTGILNVYCPSADGAPAVGSTIMSAGGAVGGQCTIFTFSFSHPSACIFESSSHKLSGGSIFDIIFFAVLFIYFVSFSIWNYRKGARSVAEIVPHFSFWTSIPGLMKDGTIFLFKKIRGGCGRNVRAGENYQDI